MVKSFFISKLDSQTKERVLLSWISLAKIITNLLVRPILSFWLVFVSQARTYSWEREIKLIF